MHRIVKRNMHYPHVSLVHITLLCRTAKSVEDHHVS